MQAFECSSFGIKHRSARCHASASFPLLQITFNIFHNLLSSFGQFLYTLYGIPFRPGADSALAFLITSFTSFNVGFFLSNNSDGGSGAISFSHSPRSLSLLGSLCSTVLSSGFLLPPLIDSLISLMFSCLTIQM